MIVVLISIIQLLVFVFGNGTISGFNSSDDLAWVAWVYLAISLPLGIASLVGFILSIRGNPNFIVYSVIVELGYFVSALAGGMMFSAMGMFLFIFLNAARYSMIKKGGPEYDINTRLIHNLMYGLFVGTIIVGIISIELDKDHVFWWNTNVYGESKFFPYLDVITIAITLTGTMMMLSRNKLAYVSFIVCDVLFIILFANAHQWSNMVITFLYIIVEVLGYIVWHNKEEKTES